MLTTSQRIAVRFAFTIAGIVLFLGSVINVAFFGSRWNREQQHFRIQQFVGQEEMANIQKIQRKFARTRGGDLGPRNMLFVPITGEEQEELREHTLFKNLAHFEDERYIYGLTPQGDQLFVVDISPVVHNQIALLWITLFAVIGSSVIGYAVAVRQVKRGLKDLQVLAKKVQSIDIDSLHNTLSFDHLPPHDEIRIVSDAIDEMTTKLHHQVATIKQFVANVSHEFKTPLMSLQSTIEVGEKTKNYAEVFDHVGKEISIMHRLLDTLTLLTRSQYDLHLEKKTFSLQAVIGSLVHTVQGQYPSVVFIQHIDEKAVLHTHQGFFERILTNILDNAGKFTPAGGMVTISADSAGCTIIDTGKGISSQQLTQIREPFWQGDAARGTEGFGLGMSLVKELITLLDRDIILKSKVGEGTSVTIKR